MELLIGAFGAVLVLLLVFAGLVIGWWAASWARERTAVRTAKELDVEERKKLLQGQEAFRMVQNYTPERAYGMYDDAYQEKGGEE